MIKFDTYYVQIFGIQNINSKMTFVTAKKPSYKKLIVGIRNQLHKPFVTKLQWTLFIRYILGWETNKYVTKGIVYKFIYLSFNLFHIWRQAKEFSENYQLYSCHDPNYVGGRLKLDFQGGFQAQMAHALWKGQIRVRGWSKTRSPPTGLRRS